MIIAHLTDLAYLAKGECPVVFHSPVRQQEYTYFIKKKKRTGNLFGAGGKRIYAQ